MGTGKRGGEGGLAVGDGGGGGLRAGLSRVGRGADEVNPPPPPKSVSLAWRMILS